MRRSSGGAVLGAAAIVVVLAGCGSSSGGHTEASASGSTTKLITNSTVLPTISKAPAIANLLKQPIATPAVCHHSNGTASGQNSPWVNTVDMSVFMKTGATAKDTRAVGRYLHSAADVARVYFESNREAYAEFQRLYTCSADLTAAQLPSSWRVVMTTGTTVGERNKVVATAQVLPGVDVTACDPSLPCVNTVRRVDPSIQPSASPSSSANGQ